MKTKQLSLLRTLSELAFIIAFSSILYLVYLLLSIIYSNLSDITILLISFDIVSISYIIYKLTFHKLIKKFYKQVQIIIIESSLIETVSSEYFDEEYLPMIKYKYTIDNKNYESDNIAWDIKSIIPKQQIFDGTLYNDKKEKAEELRLDILQHSKIAYINPIVPYISFLIPTLSRSRKIYFIYMLILIFLISIISFFLINLSS